MVSDTFKFYLSEINPHSVFRHDLWPYVIGNLHQRNGRIDIWRRLATNVLLHHRNILASGHNDNLTTVHILCDATNKANGILPAHSDTGI